jgi:hypothetical protein
VKNTLDSVPAGRKTELFGWLTEEGRFAPDIGRLLEVLCEKLTAYIETAAQWFWGYWSCRTQFRSFARRLGLHGGNMLASLFVCQFERPNGFVNVIRRYGYFCTSDPLLRASKVLRRDTPVSTVCKRRGSTGVYRYKLTACRRLLWW